MRALLPAGALVLGAVVALNLSAASATSMTLTADGTAGTTFPWQAAFTPPPVAYPLELTLTGTGTVTSSPAGISCVADASTETCRAGYDAGTSVTLTSSGDPTTWDGCDASTGTTCDVLMSGPRSVSAVLP